MKLKHLLRKQLWKLGYEVTKFDVSSSPLARRRRLLECYSIDTVLDVGANTGQFGTEIRDDLNYAGVIISFEPLSAAFAELARKAKSDDAWQVNNFALGDQDGELEINISGNFQSNSILDMQHAHMQSAPDSAFVGKERIRVRQLDALYEEMCADAINVYLKIDAQGYESKVIEGAANVLDRIDTVQVEMSLVSLYEGETLFGEMYALLVAKGYTLVALENGFTRPETGQLLQVDGIFHRFR